MILLPLSAILLLLFVNAQDTVEWRKSGESVTLVCSSKNVPFSIEEIVGMYLYHESKHGEEEEVLYYHSSSEKITPRRSYSKRVEVNGSLKNHTITISNLSVTDSGIYRCVYKKNVDTGVRSNVHILFISALAPCSTAKKGPQPPVSEEPQPLVLIISVTWAISVIATAIFILLVFKLKQWTDRRKARSVPNEYVYEVMTKSGFQLRESE